MFLFRSFVFYPLLALAAAGMILISLGPQPWAPRAPAAQDGAAGQDGAISFGPQALARLDAGDDHLVFAPRKANGQAQALHIAVKRGAPSPPGASDQGARLLLTPETARRFAGQAVRVDIDVRPVPLATAPQIAASWQGDGAPFAWSLAETGSEAKTLSFTLPAVATPKALGLYIVNTASKDTFALEIGEIRVSAVK